MPVKPISIAVVGRLDHRMLLGSIINNHFYYLALLVECTQHQRKQLTMSEIQLYT